MVWRIAAGKPIAAATLQRAESDYSRTHVCIIALGLLLLLMVTAGGGLFTGYDFG